MSRSESFARSRPPKGGKPQKGKREPFLVATHRRATHDFTIEETYEAGLILLGTEVKALRDKRVDLKGSFARFDRNAFFLYNAHIEPYRYGNLVNHDPLRKRKLLLSQNEINRLLGKVQQRGLTLVPLRLYFNERGWAKVELGLARGKKLYDKREEIAKKSAQREMARLARRSPWQGQR